MRYCKLCIESIADKTNSHIVPRWMGESMMKTDNGNKTFLLNTSTTHLPRKLSQDIDKEDYILCSSCEQYFGVIETQFKNTIHKELHGKPLGNKYIIKNNGQGIKCAEFLDEETIKLTRLLFYSIFWRISICSVGIWKSTNLKPQEEEYFREKLLEYKCIRKNELINNFRNIKFPNSPWFVLITCQDNKNKTRNFIGRYPAEMGDYKLFLNEYIITLSFPPNEGQSKFEFLNNTSADDNLKITLVDNQFWGAQIDFYINFLKENSLKFLKKEGQQYYLRNKKS